MGVQLHNPHRTICVDNEINSHQYLVVTAPYLQHRAAAANLEPLPREKIATEEFNGNQEKGRQEKETLTYAVHYLARRKVQKSLSREAPLLRFFVDSAGSYTGKP